MSLVRFDPSFVAVEQSFNASQITGCRDRVNTVIFLKITVKYYWS